MTRDNIDVYAPQALLDSLAVIRNKDTQISQFRNNADRIFQMLGDRLVENLPKRTIEIETPVGKFMTTNSDSRGVLLIGILRSGYPAAAGIRTKMPDATIGVVDMKRDEETTKASVFYDGLEGLDLSSFEQVIIPDPMLATGGSASLAINLLKERGAKNIHLVSLVSAPEGIQRIKNEHPDVRITTAAVDERLNEKSYIDPGLGDFGDRYFEPDSIEIVDELNDGRILEYREGRLLIQAPEGTSIF